MRGKCQYRLSCWHCLGDFPLTSRIKFTIFHNRNTLYRACEHWSGVSRPCLLFAVSRHIFTLLREFGAMRLAPSVALIVGHIGWGDRLHKLPLSIYRGFWKKDGEFCKCLQFVHSDSTSCTTSITITCTLCKWIVCVCNAVRSAMSIDMVETGLTFSVRSDIMIRVE